MSEVKDCPFCNLKKRVLKENDHACLFLSRSQSTRGHTLIVPKRHIEKPWELSQDELLAIFDLVAFAQQKLIGVYGGGCDVRQNYRPFLPQSESKIDHVHYHVIPRSLNDRIYEISEKRDTQLSKELPAAEREMIEDLFSEGG